VDDSRGSRMIALDFAAIIPDNHRKTCGD
jgi:hypothetical protein